MVTIAALFVSCSTQEQQGKGQMTEAQIEQRIDEILPQLTLEEKAAMCHAQSKFSTPGVPRLGIPEIWWSDGPHGVRAEINWNDWGYSSWTNDSVTAFPALSALAATFNPELSYLYGVALGEESRYRKKNVILGPGLNIYRTPLNGRNFEYMGEDPYLTSVMAVPYIQGVQSTGTATSVKHFALNNQEVDRMSVNVKVSDRALREIYLPAFKAAIVRGHAWTIMGAYNKYQDEHCCSNKTLLMDILKGEWQFDGVVVSDWGGVHETDRSVVNGLDVEMGTYTNGLTSESKFSFDDYFLGRPYVNAIKCGKFTEKELDDKVRRILRLNLRTNNGWGNGRMTCDEHMKVAHDIAKEAVVLLKNETDVLPLNKDSELKIAVVGENAVRSLIKAGGSSELKPKYEVSPLEGIRNAFPKANVEQSLGYTSGMSVYGAVLPPRENQDSLRLAALKIAKEADIVIFVGGLNKSHEQDCEGGDRKDYLLPFGQNQLIEQLVEVNPKTIVVLTSGNAVAMPWIEKVPAVVQAWYLGSELGNVVGEVLNGTINPSGKLPFSYPVKLEDSAPHSFADAVVYPGVDKQEEYREDILIGYRWHDTKDIKPLFAFGYGLSYSQFEIKNISVNKTVSNLNISATVANMGSRDGAEVVQVYVGKNDSKVLRAVKELKGFKKVSLKSGEEQMVELEVPIESLAFYNEELKSWEIEKGGYTVYVGNSSDNVQPFDVNID